MTLQKNNTVRVFKTRKNSKLPVRAHPTDAGMDFFFCPSEPMVALRIPAGVSAVIETGIKMEVPSGYMLQILNKSGIASKRHLLVGACVVDEGYDGEIFINLHNVGDKVQFLDPGQKIAQGVFVKIEKPELQVVLEDKIYDEETLRGSGALGSTGDR